MVTASLLERGLPMKTAFSVSRMVRERIGKRAEITTDELDGEVALVLESLGIADLEPMAAHLDTEQTIRLPNGVGIPRHILLRDLISVGMDIEQAMALAGKLDHQLLRQGSSGGAPVDVGRALEDLLEVEGARFSRLYALIDMIRKSDRPVILFIGGATGTGKSTLAMELAFRLGIQMAVSTDMVRETMRTVLSAQVVPGLHDHSFRGMLQGGQVLSDPRERVIAGFRQQAAQVKAGVRGVIRRALLESTHLVIEGTHLVPPFDSYLPSPDIPHAGLILAVPSKRVHRERFPARARAQRNRDASAYLDAFQSVRWIHDDLLHAAEEAETLVLPTGKVNQTAIAAMDYLSQVVLAQQSVGDDRPTLGAQTMRTLFLILDGLPDEEHEALGDLTPLQAATTPYLRMLAHEGGQGQIFTAANEGDVPQTDEGLFSLLGVQMPSHRLGRGVFEAVGQGVPLAPGAVLLRGNLATRRADNSLVDRRAGRISAGQADLLAGLRHVRLAGGIRGAIYPGHEHRVVVMLRGQGLSDALTDTDVGGEASIQRVLRPRSTDESPEAARTAAALAELLDIAADHLEAHPHNAERIGRGLLPANCVITRGAADTSHLPKVQHSPDHAALISACTTALGVGRLMGMRTTTSAAMTGNLFTDLDAKFSAAAELLQTRTFVAIHFKATDIAAHERRPLAKRDFISSVDAALGRFLESHVDVAQGLRVVVSADHGTSSVTGNHTNVPVPLLVSTWQGPGEEADFDEKSAEQGALGVLMPGDLAHMLWAS
jgi:2,3-bisphosphoglycerate-independent phosphoglycerate mutase